MFIKKTSKTVNGKTYINHLLVESVSTPKGPRHRVVCSLGNLAPAPKEEWLALARKVSQVLDCSMLGAKTRLLTQGLDLLQLVVGGQRQGHTERQ